MKLTILILTCIFFCAHENFTSETKDRLDKALKTNQVSNEQYGLFKNQIDFRSKINIQSRFDSMTSWGLDILYIEEFYYPQKDSFLVKEYYFSSKKEQAFKTIEKNEKWEVYKPDRYYENGNLSSRYFFRHKDGKEHLSSIRQYLVTRKHIDKIDAIIKKEVVHSGCGFSKGFVESVKQKTEKKYKKPQMPEYYLIESFIDKERLTISFQLPVKQTFKVIVEGHSF